MPFNRQALRKWRLERKFTQEEAARFFGLTQEFCSHLETGRKVPSLEMLEIISLRTGIPVSNLMKCEVNA